MADPKTSFIYQIGPAGDLQKIATAAPLQIGTKTFPASLTVTGNVAYSIENVMIQRQKTTHAIANNITVTYLTMKTAGTVILPSSPAAGQVQYICDSGSASTQRPITVKGYGKSTIDGQTSKVLTAAYSTASFVWQGSGWASVGSSGAVGPQGPEGQPGPAGDVGPAGPQGPQGIQGDIGPTGTNGTNGADGLDAYIADVSPPTLLLPSLPDGSSTDYSATGTTISAYKGPSALTAVNATPSSGEFSVTSAIGTNITAGSQTSPGVFDVMSAMTANSAAVTYTVNMENLTTRTLVQTLAKARQGDTGATGPTGPAGSSTGALITFGATVPNIYNVGGSALYYLYPGGGMTDASDTAIKLIVPVSGTLKNFYIYQNVIGGTATTITYTWRIVGSALSAVVTIPSNDNQASNTSSTLTVNAGDQIYVSAEFSNDVTNPLSGVVATATLI